jgi:hypothetical protein
MTTPGNSIRVIGTLNKLEQLPDANGPTLDLIFQIFDLDAASEPSSRNFTSKISTYEQTSKPLYGFQLYKSPELVTMENRSLDITILSPNRQGFFCLDSVSIGRGQFARTGMRGFLSQGSARVFIVATGVLGGLVGLLALGILCGWLSYSRHRRRLRELEKGEHQKFEL